MEKKSCLSGLLLFFLVYAIGCGGRYNLPPQQEQAIYRAVSIAVPSATNISIKAYGSQEDIRLLISAHLLNNELYTNTSPVVRGQYYNHSLLTEMAQMRCAQIIRGVMMEAKVPNINKIQINVNHGVRVTTRYIGSYSSSTSTSDRAMTLMTVEINMKKLAGLALNEETIMKNWSVQSNIIPNIHFSSF
ncbi:MAG: hypothetical protein WCX17_03730 [Parcubacteria group bacterium]|jgi:hypothetical protein